MTPQSVWRWRKYVAARTLLIGGAAAGTIIGGLVFSVISAIFLISSDIIPRPSRQAGATWVAVSVLLAAGCAAVLVVPLIRRKVASRWGMSCRNCGDIFEWPQYEYFVKNGWCRQCFDRSQPPQVEVYSASCSDAPLPLAAGPLNPYAAPPSAGVAAAPAVHQTTPKQIENPVAILLLLALFGWLVPLLAVKRTVEAVYRWALAAREDGSDAAWLRKIACTERRADALGLVWWIALGIVFFVASFATWLWLRPDDHLIGRVIASHVLSGFSAALALLILRRRRFHFRRTAYVVPIDPTSQRYRLTFFWPPPVKTTNLVTLKFRTQSPGGVLAKIFDADGRNIHTATCSPTEAEGWSEGTLPMEALGLMDAPVNSIRVVVESHDNCAWAIPYEEPAG